MKKTFKQYQVLSRLSHTAYKQLYLAHTENNPQQTLVIKVFSAEEVKGQPQRNECFLEQVEIFKRLSHRYILPVLDAGIEQQEHYLVTRLLTGGSLQDRLTTFSNKPLPLDEAITILKQTGEALFAAHQQGIVHGHLKPENILFDEHKDVQLTDFSLLQLMSEQWRSEHTKRRNAYYMAPEQFAGRSSQQSDQYALACIAYEMLSGHVPFAGLARSTLEFRHQVDIPKSVHSSNPEVSEGVSKVILKALSKDVADRYKDIASFLSSLLAASSENTPHEIASPTTPCAKTRSSEEMRIAAQPTLALPSGSTTLQTASALRRLANNRRVILHSSVAGLILLLFSIIFMAQHFSASSIQMGKKAQKFSAPTVVARKSTVLSDSNDTPATIPAISPVLPSQTPASVSTVQNFPPIPASTAPKVSSSPRAQTPNSPTAIAPSSSTQPAAKVTPTPSPVVSANYSVTPSWPTQDIGSVNQRGSMSYSGGTFTIAGSGSGIASTEDSFHFVYQQLRGNGQIIARITQVHDSHPTMVAGVMIRDSLDPGASTATLSLSKGNVMTFQARTDDGQASSPVTSSSAEAPYWVKLTRTGNTITGYTSSDGTNWTQTGQTTLQLKSSFYLGMAVAAGDANATTTGVFDSVIVKSI